MMFEPTLDLRPVEQIVRDHGRGPESVVPILQAIQSHYRYLPTDALRMVSDLTDITPAALAGVSTFYDAFRHRPVGKQIISVCHGTACHVKGSTLIQAAIEAHLKIPQGSDTTEDGQFTVLPAACFGCCTLAPVIRLDEQNCGHLRAQDVPSVIERAKAGEAIEDDRLQVTTVSSKVGEIRIGLGSCCMAQGSGQLFDALTRAVNSTGAGAAVKGVGCIGMCHQTPLIQIVQPNGTSTFYSKTDPKQVKQIVMRHFKPRGVVRRLGAMVTDYVDRLYAVSEETYKPPEPLGVLQGPVCAFLGPQKHIATEYCGDINPLDLDEYLRHDGFVALERCLRELTPEQIVDEVRQSGLRGRGGAGFPTHVKWTRVQQASSPTKYIICNGDEGDPGAFMDRMILESYPYRVIEGMSIAARAIGASQGYFYIRAEYPEAVKRVRAAIERCRKAGWLGDSIAGTGFKLDLVVAEGAGAFVCGEETALLHSLEGQRGTPRLRPPYPAECGFREQPTLINNVETYAMVPWIFRHGANAFASLGTEKSKGTKVFALAGRIVHGGLIEVPMGITLRQIVEQIGGGVGPGRTFKAVQVGGPSGGCVPAALADTPVDYESLAQLGTIMGSGGLVVLDDTDCMVDIARYFLRFTQSQSCGKCTFCRVGTRRMLDILDRICTGRGRPNDLQLLEQLSRMVGGGSLCGLGKTAPNPVLSTLKYFREEFEAHLQGRCPAGRCKDLIHYRVEDHCIGCTLCAQHCPVDAIPFTPYVKHVIDDDRCIRCDACRTVCPEEAVTIASPITTKAVPCRV